MSNQANYWPASRNRSDARSHRELIGIPRPFTGVDARDLGVLPGTPPYLYDPGDVVAMHEAAGYSTARPPQTTNTGETWIDPSATRPPADTTPAPYTAPYVVVPPPSGSRGFAPPGESIPSAGPVPGGAAPPPEATASPAGGPPLGSSSQEYIPPTHDPAPARRSPWVYVTGGLLVVAIGTGIYLASKPRKRRNPEARLSSSGTSTRYNPSPWKLNPCR